MSWLDAKLYVQWLSHKTGRQYRLPTEAEWEYAARCRKTAPDAITPNIGNLENKLGKTTRVDQYLPNDWGLYDMYGNVWEWVEDVWHETYKSAPPDGTAWTWWTDKEGKSSRTRVVRGGSWSTKNFRLADRAGGEPDVGVNDLGFRIAVGYVK